MNREDIFWAVIIVLISVIGITGAYNSVKIEHEKTIQKAIECGYQPLCIGGDYWNKGD